MDMIGQILLGFSWTCLTIGIAVIFIVILTETTDATLDHSQRSPSPLQTGIVLTLSVIWMLVGILCVVFAWAWLFVLTGIFEDFESSFYFAIVSATTVGFGDVVLSDEWRILSGFAAAGGFIIFGLDTAVLLEVIRRLRANEHLGSAVDDADRNTDHRAASNQTEETYHGL
ncbi:MAG: potassium channel family protein [Pseudomonadota bacterium]